MAGANLSVGIKHQEFTSGMRDMQTQLKNTKSEFNLASTQAKLYGTTTDQLKAKQADLTKKLELHNKQLQLLKDRSSAVTNDVGKLKDRQGDLSKEIEKTTQKYNDSVKATGKNSEESQKLKADLEKLKTEYNQNEKAIESKGKQLDTLNNKMNDTQAAILENADALDEVNQSIKNVPFDEVAEKFDKVGDKAINAGKTMSIASAAIAGVGTASIAAFNEVDAGSDIVIKATGATGEAAKELEQNYKNVASVVKDSFDQVGSALGEINTRFGFTNEQLEGATEDFLKFAEINGVDVTQAVQLVSRAMGDAGIDASEYNNMLDMLTKASQASGISIESLTGMVTQYGAPMRALGFDTQESIAIFSQWELAGVNTEIAFSGMKAAIGKWGKEGKDARVEFGKTIDEIGKAPSIAEATAMAIEVFGQKAGPDLADAIQGGRFEYENFMQILDGSVGTVENTFAATQDATDKAAIAVNAAKIAMADLGGEILTMATPAIEAVTEGVQNAAKWFGGLDSGTKQTMIGIAGVVAAIGPGLIAFGALSKGVGNGITAFRDMYNVGTKLVTKLKEFGPTVADNASKVAGLVKNVGASTIEFAKMAVQSGIATAKMIASKVATVSSTIATGAMSAAQAALNFVMSLNPITLVIVGIVALGAAFVVLWNKCEWFRNGLTALWEGLKTVITSAKDFIVNAFNLLWTTVKTITESYLNSLFNFWKGIFENIKNIVQSVFTNISSIIKAVISTIVTIVQTQFNLIKNTISNIINGVKTVIANVFGLIKGIFTGDLNLIKTSVTNIFGAIKTTISNILNGAKDIVKGAIDKIRGFFNFEWSLPKLKLPHFKISGSFSLNPPSIPSFGVDWYHTGAIFNKRTILPGGIGVGDAYKGTGNNAEAIIPLDSMYRKIDEIVGLNLLAKEKVIEVKLMIENFYNKTDKDIETIVKEITYYLKKEQY